MSFTRLVVIIEPILYASRDTVYTQLVLYGPVLSLYFRRKFIASPLTQLPNPSKSHTQTKAQEKVPIPDLMRPQKISQLVHISVRTNLPNHKLFLTANTSQNAQRAPKLPLQAKPNISIRAITHHTSTGAIKAKLPLNSIHHGLVRLPQRDGLAPKHHDQRGAHGPRAGEECARAGQGRVDVRREEDGAAADVVECERQLQVVDVEVEADEHDADFGVDQGGVAGCDPLVVFGGDVATQGRVCAADEGHVFGAEFLLDACFADDEDFAFVGWEGEDA